MVAPPLAALLTGLFADAPIGLGLLDRELHERYANAQLTAFGGVPDAARALLADVLERGEPRLGVELEDADAEGRRLALLVSAYPLRDEDGAVAGAGLAVVDITERRALERDRDEALALLDALFEAAPVGLGSWDRELRYTRVNAALAEMNGVSADEHVGRTVPDVLPGIPSSLLDDFRNVIERGEPLLGRHVQGETPAQPGELRSWNVSMYPVRDRVGRVLGAGAVVQETTTLERVEAARKALGEELERDRVLLADLVNRAPAAIGLVRGPEHRFVLANAEMRELLRTDELQGRGAAEVLPAEAGPGALALLDRVLATGGPLRDVDFALPWPDPGAFRGQRFFSFTLDPVTSAGAEPGGVLVVAVETTAEVRRREELEEELRAERAIAATLQRALLPRTLPEVPGLELAARYEAAGERYAVGGDFYDAAPLHGGGWLVVVGDVCGKGPEAAALTAMARYTLRAEAAAEAEPGRLLALLNAEVLRQLVPEHGEPLRFVTVALAAVEMGEGRARVRLGLAGHPSPVVLRAGGGWEVAGEAGPPTGVVSGASYDQVEIELARGDLLVLYTDGVLDAHAPQTRLDPAGLGARLVEAGVRTAAETATAVADLVAEVPGDPRDDYAVLALRVLD